MAYLPPHARKHRYTPDARDIARAERVRRALMSPCYPPWSLTHA